MLSLQSLEAFERIQRIKGSTDEAIEDNANLIIDIKNIDYRLVDISKGSVIYCDPPYKHAKNSKRYTGNDFDYAAFERWLQVIPYQVYVSEVTPPAGCVEIGQTKRESSMAANTSGKVIEKIFTQERFME